MVTHHSVVVVGWSLNTLSDSRIQAIIVALLVGVGLEILTPVPGLRLLVALGMIAAPAVCFVLLWKGLVWLRQDRQYDLLARRHRSDWHGRKKLWTAFWVLWAADVLAAVVFVLHPAFYEVNWITVLLFERLGAVGVIFAGLSYASIVVVLVKVLPMPYDVDILSVSVVLYALLAVTNYVLLFSRGFLTWFF